MATVNPSAEHVLGRLDALLLRVRTVVDARRGMDPALDDPFLGLYVSEDRALRLLDGRHPTPHSEEAAVLAGVADRRGAELDTRLHRIQDRFELSDTEVDALIVCLAPDVDARFEPLYGFCNDDVTLKRATVGLAIELLGSHPAAIEQRDLFTPDSRLLNAGLVSFDSTDRPFLTRSIVVPDRVTSFLLGGDRADPRLAAVQMSPAGWLDQESERLANVLVAGIGFIYVIDPKGRAPELCAGATDALGRPSVAIDLRRVGSTTDLAAVAEIAAREAMLTNGVLYAGPIDHLVDVGPSADVAVRSLAELRCPVVLSGRTSWDPAWGRHVPLQIALQPVSSTAGSTWRELASDLPAELTCSLEGQFQLRPEEVRRAADAARMLAVWDGAEITRRHVSAAARQQNGARLERLARRLEPAVGWDDLVLPDLQLQSLRRLADRARHRTTVLGTWGMRPGGGRGMGVMALFAGDSGTGKTMSAEVLAGDLGLDLYVVNLATVVDKYVGETEKNLDRIFSDADSVNGVLLFDEADALFGSRSEVRDSHDRYANLEIAYLLQRMESFDGIALLSTNLRANLDDAFARRLDATIEFPVPQAVHRRHLWELTLSPLSLDDVDLDFCAGSFELTGGNIRSAGITCGYLAAASDGVVTMPMVIRSIADEYRKLGRLCLESEFGPYLTYARI